MAGLSRGSALSYSSFHTYEDCPQRWKLLYVDQLPEAAKPYFSFGRSMHLALEAFVAPLVVPRAKPAQQRTLTDFTDLPAPSPMPVNDLLQHYERVWVKEGYGSEGEERKYFLVGRDLLTRYHEIFTSAPPRPLAVEQDLRGKMDGVPIHGIVDRIDLSKQGRLVIVDYKTSRELSVRDAVTSDQLTFYQLLVEQNYDESVESLILYHLRSLTPLSSPPRGSAEIANLSGRVAVVAEGMSSGRFEPKVGARCARCEFRKSCPAFARVR
jgi:CRISPR/Cas system-associated exonuclease Cas4 (RecB family)